MNNSLKQRKKKTVLVLMTGRLDSTVVAYLLKKQGYKCIGMSILMLNDTAIRVQKDDSEEFSEIKLQAHCHVQDLGAVKAICDSLEMPFYAVDATKEFYDQVVARAIASKISGEDFSPCVSCTKLKLHILNEKAKLLKVDKVATGHYARIHRNTVLQEFSILASSDHKVDQSYLLSSVVSDDLKNLELPLGEINTKDVEKLKELLPLKPLSPSSSGEGTCMGGDPDFYKYVEYKTTPDLRRSGSVIRNDDDMHIAEHDGIHHFNLGSNKYKILGNASIDSGHVALKIHPGKGSVSMGSKRENLFNKIVLRNVTLDSNYDLSRPIHIVVRNNQSSPFIPAIMFFKNNSNLLLELETKDDSFFIGQHVSIYFKTAHHYKVIGGGEVASFSDWGLFSRIPMPEDFNGESSSSSMMKWKVKHDYYF